MGHPLNKRFFGATSLPGSQIKVLSARVAGQSAGADYSIVRQTGTGRYIVTNGTHTGTVRLVGAGTLQAGQAHVIVKPFGGGANEYARVINSRTVKTFSGNVYSWKNSPATKVGQADITDFEPAVVWTVAPSMSRPNSTLLGVAGTFTQVPGAVVTYSWKSGESAEGPFTYVLGADGIDLPVTEDNLGTYFILVVTVTVGGVEYVEESEPYEA